MQYSCIIKKKLVYSISNILSYVKKIYIFDTQHDYNYYLYDVK